MKASSTAEGSPKKSKPNLVFEPLGTDDVKAHARRLKTWFCTALTEESRRGVVSIVDRDMAYLLVRMFNRQERDGPGFFYEIGKTKVTLPPRRTIMPLRDLPLHRGKKKGQRQPGQRQAASKKLAVAPKSVWNFVDDYFVTKAIPLGIGSTQMHTSRVPTLGLVHPQSIALAQMIASYTGNTGPIMDEGFIYRTQSALERIYAVEFSPYSASTISLDTHFIQQIRLCDTIEYMDTITFTSALLREPEQFLKALKNASRGHVFETSCKVTMKAGTNRWKWEKPKWNSTMGFSTLATYVACIVEQRLWQRYWEVFKEDPRREPKKTAIYKEMPNKLMLVSKTHLVKFWQDLSVLDRRVILAKIGPIISNVLLEENTTVDTQSYPQLLSVLVSFHQVKNRRMSAIVDVLSGPASDAAEFIERLYLSPLDVIMRRILVYIHYAYTEHMLLHDESSSSKDSNSKSKSRSKASPSKTPPSPSRSKVHKGSQSSPPTSRSLGFSPQLDSSSKSSIQNSSSDQNPQESSQNTDSSGTNSTNDSSKQASNSHIHNTNTHIENSHLLTKNSKIDSDSASPVQPQRARSPSQEHLPAPIEEDRRRRAKSQPRENDRNVTKSATSLSASAFAPRGSLDLLQTSHKSRHADLSKGSDLATPESLPSTSSLSSSSTAEFSKLPSRDTLTVSADNIGPDSVSEGNAPETGLDQTTRRVKSQPNLRKSLRIVINATGNSPPPYSVPASLATSSSSLPLAPLSSFTASTSSSSIIRSSPPGKSSLLIERPSSSPASPQVSVGSIFSSGPMDHHIDTHSQTSSTTPPSGYQRRKLNRGRSSGESETAHLIKPNFPRSRSTENLLEDPSASTDHDVPSSPPPASSNNSRKSRSPSTPTSSVTGFVKRILPNSLSLRLTASHSSSKALAVPTRTSGAATVTYSTSPPNAETQSSSSISSHATSPRAHSSLRSSSPSFTPSSVSPIESPREATPSSGGGSLKRTRSDPRSLSRSMIKSAEAEMPHPQLTPAADVHSTSNPAKSHPGLLMIANSQTLPISTPNSAHKETQSYSPPSSMSSSPTYDASFPPLGSSAPKSTPVRGGTEPVPRVTRSGPSSKHSREREHGRDSSSSRSEQRYGRTGKRHIERKHTHDSRRERSHSPERQQESRTSRQWTESQEPMSRRSRSISPGRERPVIVTPRRPRAMILEDLEACPPELAEKLTAEVNLFHSTVCEIMKLREAEVNIYMRKITKLLTSLWPTATIHRYGSYATNLAIPSSDLDLFISFPMATAMPLPDLKKEYTRRYYLLAELIEKKKWVRPSSVQRIDTAKVPVIKLLTKSLLAIDISFPGSVPHNGENAKNLVRHFCECHPELQSLAYVLKFMLYKDALNNPYTGGLGSYGLVLMIVSFLQIYGPGSNLALRRNKKFSLGSILFEFLQLYGTRFDFESIEIRVESEKSPASHTLLPTPQSPAAMIMDPFEANKIVSSSSFLIWKIKNSFMTAYRHLDNFLPDLLDALRKDEERRQAKLNSI